MHIYGRKQLNNESLVVFVGAFIVLVLGAIQMSIPLLMTSFAMMLLSMFVSAQKRLFYIAAVVSWFTVEQISFQVFSGTFRLYFIISMLLVVLLFCYIGSIFQSAVLRWYLAFLGGAIMLCLFSSAPLGAFKSTLFLLLNALPAVAVYLLISSGVFSLEKFQDLLRNILRWVILFGLLQYVLYRITGVAVSLNPSAAQGQLAVSQIPGLRQEANTHGKMVCWAIVYCIPPLVRQAKNRKQYSAMLLLSGITLLLSMTRSALFAMVMALALALIWYTFSGKAGKMVKLLSVVVAIGTIVIVLFGTGLIEADSYSAYKLQSVLNFNSADIASDGSASFRLESMEVALSQWRQSLGTVLFGVGYGQAFGKVTGAAGVIRTGGSDFIGILTGMGVIGFSLFVGLNLCSWFSSAMASRKATNEGVKIFSEQMLFCGLYSFCICFLSGILACPEAWIAIGGSAVSLLVVKRERTMDHDGR